MRKPISDDGDRDKSADLFDDRARLAGIVRLLGNNATDGEIIAAARALNRTLEGAGGLHSLAEFLKANWRPPQSEPRPREWPWSAQPKPPPEPKFDWQILADRLLQYLGLLIRSARIDEFDFLTNMRRSRSCPTEKQWKWMSDIEARLPRRAA
jgi:hypothetical protein